jgi:hypothetical protein
MRACASSGSPRTKHSNSIVCEGGQRPIDLRKLRFDQVFRAKFPPADIRICTGVQQIERRQHERTPKLVALSKPSRMDPGTMPEKPRVRYSLPAPSLKINDLCRDRGVCVDFPNTFSLDLPVCPSPSIHALAERRSFFEQCLLIRISKLSHGQRNSQGIPGLPGVP